MSLSDRLKSGAERLGSAAGHVREAVSLGLTAAGIKARYDAGSRRKRLKGWQGDNASINTETTRSLPLIRQRSRDLVANHWAAARAKSVIQHNTIGSGILPRSKDNERVDKLLKFLCSSTQLDPRRSKTLSSLQKDIIGSVVESGEVLIVRQHRGGADMRRLGLKIPMQIQVLESDHLDSLKDGVTDKGTVIKQGIEFDHLGTVVAYHLHMHHPGEFHRWRRLESRRVLAKDVIHVFDEWRPGQVRGLPWGITAMVKMRDLADYEDAQLLKQKIAAAFAAFIHHNEQHDLGTLYDPDGVPQAMQPGTVEYLRPGEDVTFSDPPTVAGMADFSRISTRAIAAAYNVTYESLTNDYSNVNFSSGRMGWLEMQRHIESWQSDLVIAQFCLRLEEWIREAAALVGINSDGEPWRWKAPRREMIDPVRETAAMISQIRSGLDDRENAVRSLGRASEDVDEATARANARADDLGIIYDSDARNTTQAGLTPQLVSEQASQPNGDAHALVEMLQESGYHDLAQSLAETITKEDQQ